MSLPTLLSLALEHGGAAAWRIALGGVVAGVLTLLVVVAAIVFARKKRLLEMNVSIDPWPGRAIILAWVLVVIPSGAAVGALLGAAFAASNALETTHATERASALAIHAVVDKVFADRQVASLLDGERIAIDRVAFVFERAPAALADVVANHAELVIRDDDADSAARKLAARIAAGMAHWIVASQAEDRLLLAQPVIKDLIRRDVDRDGMITIDDVVISSTTTLVAPRVRKLAFDVVASQSYAAAAVAVGVLVAPLLLCFGVRAYRARRTT